MALSHNDGGPEEEGDDIAWLLLQEFHPNYSYIREEGQRLVGLG